jgi:DNA polymerase III subunit epsilon
MTKQWYELPLLSLDTETTGVDVFEDRVVTCNMTYDYGNGQPSYTADWMINPGIDIPEGASEVHGITTEIAKRDGGDPYTVLLNIAQHLKNWDNLGFPVVIFNASFDASLLNSEFDRFDISRPCGWNRVIDPLVLDKGLDPFRKGSRKLIDMARHYGIELSEEDAHNASFDSGASVQIARKIGEQWEIDVPVEEVHAKQIIWKKKQSAGFQKYLREKEQDNTIVINDEWPFQTKDAT